MQLVTTESIADAPERSFGRSFTMRADLRAWYGSPDTEHAAQFRIGGKTDAARDGSDSQLRDILCRMAGIARTPKLDENGSPVLSEKRGKPVFVAYTSADRGEALKTLGLREKIAATIGDSKLIALEKVGATVALPDVTDEDEDEGSDEDE